jgi:hypothetical protein
VTYRTKVYVIMGNDFPDAVFMRRIDADRYCRAKQANERRAIKAGLILGPGPRVYWRWYEFPLQYKLGTGEKA